MIHNEAITQGEPTKQQTKKKIYCTTKEKEPPDPNKLKDMN